MKLQDLYFAKNLIIQILWGEKVIEFYTGVIDRDADGVFITPYLHNGAPLGLNINQQSGVVCNIFGDNPEDGKRISWRNVDLKTTTHNGQVVYYLTTSAYNSVAQVDERRVEDRVRITREATLREIVSGKSTQIRIHDVSDSGIAFYAPTTFQPESNAFVISFSDSINGHDFTLEVKCHTVRTKSMPGTVFYGCRITEDHRDYLLYGCLMRLKKNAAGGADE